MYFANTNISSGKGKGSRDYAPNQRIPEDAFSQKEFDRLVAAGKVSSMSRASVTEPVLEAGEETDLLKKGHWSFREEDLLDLGIEDLNMLIEQHIEKHGLKKIAPFEDFDEAVAFMTQEKPEEGDEE